MENNDFQAQQALSAQSAAQSLNIDLEVIPIEHDAVAQSQQVLKLLQSPNGSRPDGILFEPVGTPLAQAAKIAASSGVAWAVLNRELDYAADLRRQSSAPVFSVTTRHSDVGRIQGEQIARLVPAQATVLYVTGPSDNNAAQQRTAGMQEAKPRGVDIRVLKGLWTEKSAYNAISSWMKLRTAKDLTISLVAAQNDAMAIGARKAFQELASGAERERWLRLPFVGCDGLPGSGQAAVMRGELAATVVIPPNAGAAIEAMVKAIRSGQQPPECIYTTPTSYPPLESLRPRR